MARKKATKKRAVKKVEPKEAPVEKEAPVGECIVGVEKKLVGLASKEPWKDDFHQGIANDELAIELEFGKFLRDLVVKHKPDAVVEVGTGAGYSTSWMLLGLEENKKGKLFTVDNGEGPRIYVCEKVGLSDKKLTVLKGTLQENLKEIPKKVELVFLDSNHCIDVIAKDIEDLVPRLSKGAVICVHDVNYCREMGNLLPEFFHGNDTPALNNCGVKAQKPGVWAYDEISNACGLGIAKKLK